MKILVAHRNENILSQIKILLKDVNPYIRYFKSGLDGFIASRMELFEIVICATDLPIVTGYELARSVRHTSDHLQTAIIFISDGIDKNAIYLGMKLHASGIVLTSEIDQVLPNLVVEAMLQIKYDVNFFSSVN